MRQKKNLFLLHLVCILHTTIWYCLYTIPEYLVWRRYEICYGVKLKRTFPIPFLFMHITGSIHISPTFIHPPSLFCSVLCIFYDGYIPNAVAYKHAISDKFFLFFSSMEKNIKANNCGVSKSFEMFYVLFFIFI